MTTPKTDPKSGGDAGKVVVIIAGVVLVGLGVLFLVTHSTAPSNPGQQRAERAPQADDEAATTAATPESEPDEGGVAPPETASSLMSTARRELNDSRPARAVALLEAGLERYEQDQAMLAMFAEALFAHGEALEREGDAERARARKSRALEEIERAIFLGPDDASHRDFAASIANELGMTDKAETHWARAQRLAPNNPKYPLYRAQMQLKMEDNDGARSSLAMAVAIDETIPEAWASLAGVAMEAGNLRPALDHISKARELEPDNRAWKRTEATIRRRLGQPERAATLLTSIDEWELLNSDDMLRELSLCYGMLREPGRAVELYERAIRLRDNEPDPHFELALWAQRAGDLELALAASNRAAALGDRRATALVEQLREELGD